MLNWIEGHGGLFQAITVPMEAVTEDVEHAESTVYDALARLTALGLLVHDETGGHRVNARTSSPPIPTCDAWSRHRSPTRPSRRTPGRRRPGNGPDAIISTVAEPTTSHRHDARNSGSPKLWLLPFNTRRLPSSGQQKFLDSLTHK